MTIRNVLIALTSVAVIAGRGGLRNIEYFERDDIEPCFNGYGIVGSAFTCR